MFALTAGAEHQRHVCPQCGRTYKWRSSLKSHLQNECGKEPKCICPYCTYRCKVRSNLLKHLRNYHKSAISPGAPTGTAPTAPPSPSPLITPPPYHNYPR
ncbi:unnamed protein product [Bemisia tabaci]|uniref:C2H2-type domain-containing protein n=2 Tax=Bemisia tabaci TaxID=7038 RepID=A0A9N9ZZW1_BEMTA|nr:unnamed protein product [Bemisia tabaci]